MPEGPSILILKEAVSQFKGKKVVEATGTAKIDMARLDGQKIIDFKSWGKHFLICFKGFTLRIHLLMFGTYLINERKALTPRLSLLFKGDELNFYTCAINVIEGDINDAYDWEVDIMSDTWNVKKAIKAASELKDTEVCDLLLNQDVVAGSGNIIKNEVLFRVKIHPKTKVGALPPKKLKELMVETSNYAFDFYEWKKKFELKKHWLIYTKKKCSNCGGPVTKEYLGKTKRRTFFCPDCQIFYKPKGNKK